MTSSHNKVAGKPSASSGAETSSNSGLRRSVRETPSKRTTTSSPSSITRKSERLEKQNSPSPLRRSDRGKKQSSSSSSGSKESSSSSSGLILSSKSVGLSVKKKKLKKEKSVAQLTLETKQVGTTKKKDARMYRQLFKAQPEKPKSSGYRKEQKLKDKLSQESSSHGGNGASKNVDSGKKCSQSNCSGINSETLEESNCGVNKSVNEIVEDILQSESSQSCQDHSFMGEGHQSEVGDSLKASEDVDCAVLSSHEAMSEELNDAAEMGKKSLQPDLVHPFLLEKGAPETNVVLEGGYKETPSTKERNTVDIDCDAAVTSSNRDICTSVADNIVEYWVPVQLPNIQLEQYCATLLLNSLSLFSSSKNDPVGAIRDTLVSTRTCCDHPYVMDPSVQESFKKEQCTAAELLDIGIKASGKLQILDAMLLEIRNKGLRVLILFKSSGGTVKYDIGDILDDFMCQRFGKDSYERVDGFVSPSKKQASLNNFNNQEERFVFLLETYACVSSIKLSSVDTVIIFGSDWSPTNDLKYLQRITFDKLSEQLKIFRLYSSFTVEENVLVLAKQGKPIDCNLQSIKRLTSDSLLMWGVSYLFDKLDEFHFGSKSVTSGTPSLEQLPLKDTIQEFLNVLNQNVKYHNTSTSIIFKAKQNQGCYSTDLPLPGECLIQSSSSELPHIFWKKLLEGKQPRWKYPSGVCQRNRKRVLHTDVDEVVKHHKKMTDNEVNPISPRPATPAWNIVSRNSTGSFGSSAHYSHGKHTSTTPSLVDNLLEVQRAVLVKSDEIKTSLDSQKSLHLRLRPQIAKLCQILLLPENVEAMAERLLEYIINNHQVSSEQESILQAFQISLCWTAASLQKHKLGHKESLALAKQHLNFICRKDEADIVYSMLRCLKKMFLQHTGDITVSGSPKDSQSLDKDHFHERSLQATPLQKMKVGLEDHCQEFFDDKVLSQLGFAKQDVLKSIRGIEKKCHKQVTILSQKQQEEKDETERKYKEEKAQLVNKQNTEAAVIRLLGNNSIITEKLKLLGIEFAKKFEELERQREKHLKDLELDQQSAMNKLKEHKASWLNEIKSFASSEIMNKVSSNAIVHRQENVTSSNSHLKEQNLGGIGNLQDSEALVEVLEASSSKVKEDLLVRLPPRNEQITNEDDMLRVSKGISSRDGLANSDTANFDSSEEQIPSASISLGASGAVNSNDGQGNSIRKLSYNVRSFDGAMDDGNTIVEKEDGADAVPRGNATKDNQLDEMVRAVPCSNAAEVDLQDERVCNGNQNLHSKITGGDQQNVEFSSRVPENASDGVAGDKTVKQHDGDVLMDNISNEKSNSSDGTAARNQENEESQSKVPECIEVVDGETSKKLDLEVQTDDTIDNHDPQSLDRTGGVVEVASTDRNDVGVCSVGNVDDQQDRVIASRESEINPCGTVELGCSDREMSEACGEASSNNTGLQHSVVSGINEDDHPEEPHLAVQDESSRPIVSTRLQEVATANGDHNSMRQVDASVPLPDDIIASTRTDGDDVPVIEHVLQIHLAPSMDSASGVDAMNLPSNNGIRHQETHDGPTNNIIEGSTQILHNVMEHSNGATLQPMTHIARHPPVSSVVNLRPPQAESHMSVPPVPSCSDPLQNESERLLKEREQIIKKYEDDKQQVISDCEKEIQEVVAKVRGQYENKIQEMESVFNLKKKELDMNRNIVLMNKILAEAFRSKCVDMNASGAPGLQREVASSFQQLLQISSQPDEQRNATVNGLSSVALPAGSPQHISPSLHSTPPSMPVHHSPFSSGTQTRPPVISSISPTIGNPQIACEIRAPAPHLQSYISSLSAISTNVPSSSVGMPRQPWLSSLPTTSTTTALPLLKSHPPCVARQPEVAGIMSPLSDPSRSMLELLRDAENQANVNSSSLQYIHLGANTVTTENRTNVGCTGEVVCLSDDDD